SSGKSSSLNSITVFQKSLDAAVETAPTSARSLPSQADQPTQVGFALLLRRFQSPGATIEKPWLFVKTDLTRKQNQI
ncbi:MAG TPA: hypothetical protein VF429_05610, partial [Anaerolineae bacterium]